MGNVAIEALRERRLAFMRECIAETERTHNKNQVDEAIRRAQHDADRIIAAGSIRQGVLKLTK